MADTKQKERAYFYAVGRRKSATARVRILEGTGKITVNDVDVSDYFKFDTQYEAVSAPLKLAGQEKKMDVTVKVNGGGLDAQSIAVRHGISRALVVMDAGLRAALKGAGYMTRDPRTKERKKYGLHGARRAPQFSKR